MGRKRKISPGPPPPTGGYDFEVLELGPAVYLTPPPAVKARGGVIPVGDGEGLPQRPAPGPRRRGPKTSAARQIADLRQLVLAVAREVTELRQELEQLKVLVEYSESRTTFEEY